MHDTESVSLLTDSIDTANPLLDAHRIPRQIVIDNHSAKLQVDAFTPDFRRKEYLHRRIVPEPIDLGQPFFVINFAVNHGTTHVVCAQSAKEVPQRSFEIRENYYLLISRK